MAVDSSGNLNTSLLQKSIDRKYRRLVLTIYKPLVGILRTNARQPFHNPHILEDTTNLNQSRPIGTTGKPIDLQRPK
jgi:hypothetical protein